MSDGKTISHLERSGNWTEADKQRAKLHVKHNIPPTRASVDMSKVARRAKPEDVERALATDSTHYS